LDTINKYYRVERSGIGYLKHVIESYEGIAAIRTVDETDSIVEIMIAPGFEDVMDKIIHELKSEYQIARVEKPSGIEPL
jgi:hypothetical protein